MIINPPRQDMKTPPRRKRRWMLWLMLAFSFSLILGTVLLSNDMRNLRPIALRLGFTLSEKADPAPPLLQSVALRAPHAVTASFAPGLLRQADSRAAADFLRTWRISGPAMCQALRDADIQMTDWAPTAFDPKTFECSFERIIRNDKGQILNSLFIVLRGDEKQALTGMRVKIVNPSKDAGGQIDEGVMHVFAIMLDQPQWLDFHETLEAIRNLRNIKEEGFGANIDFSQEVSNPGSFNFTLSLGAATDPQRRTKNYFSAKAWLPSPEPLAELQHYWK